MRRLVQHALTGLGITALAAGAAVAGVGAPAEGTVADPVTVVNVSPSTTTGASSAASDAERTARQTEANRSSSRDQLSESALAQAIQRSAALRDQGRSITREQDKIAAQHKAAAAAAKARAQKLRAQKARAAAAAKKAAAARAAKKAAAAKAARERRQQVAARGYQPGTSNPREIARQILRNKYGYGADQFSCFNNVIIRESNWDINATNAASGAYGIPQALPGSKMASVGSDWRTNPATQIIWAVGYMKSSYGSPCGAWGFKSSHGWY
ncbi:MAG: hypothetical protein ACJ72G_02890 [Friedmanniella sp.]|jgi:hypothetical protein